MYCLTVEIAFKRPTERPDPVGSGFSLCASNPSFELPQPQHTPPTITNSYYLGVSVVMVVRCKHLREWCGNYAFFQFLKTTSSMTRPSDVDQCPSEDAQTVRIGSITCWQQIRTVTRVSEWFNPVFQWGDNRVQWFTAVVGGMFCHVVLGFVMVVIGHRGIDWKLTLWGFV